MIYSLFSLRKSNFCEFWWAVSSVQEDSGSPATVSERFGFTTPMR